LERSTPFPDQRGAVRHYP